jgi:type II secretory pathway pseudopilin PulG
MQARKIMMVSVIALAAVPSMAQNVRTREACDLLVRTRMMDEVHSAAQLEKFIRACQAGTLNLSARSISRTPHANPQYNVYSSDGRFVGADPDPMVRDELRREAE